MKTCSMCNEAKPATEYHKRAKSADGLQGRCKACARALDAKRYSDPAKREAMLQANRTWHKENALRANDRRRERRRETPEWQANEAERGRRANLALAGMKQCTRCGEVLPRDAYHKTSNNGDGLAAYCMGCNKSARKQWYEANRALAIATLRAYEAANTQRVSEWRHAITMRYWARKRGASNSAVRVDAVAIRHRRQMWGGRCYLCGAEATAMDHVIPLASGGPHVPANLRPICQPCNSAKGAKSWRRFVGATA